MFPAFVFLSIYRHNCLSIIVISFAQNITSYTPMQWSSIIQLNQFLHITHLHTKMISHQQAPTTTNANIVYLKFMKNHGKLKIQEIQEFYWHNLDKNKFYQHNTRKKTNTRVI